VSKTKYFKTTFTITVLTEDRPVSAGAEIGDVVRDFYDGDSIGNVERTSAVEIPSDKIQDELLEIGNDGSFFSLGDDEEDDDE
jgi:hypothetical protein